MAKTRFIPPTWDLYLLKATNLGLTQDISSPHSEQMHQSLNTFGCYGQVNACMHPNTILATIYCSLQMGQVVSCKEKQFSIFTVLATREDFQ